MKHFFYIIFAVVGITSLSFSVNAQKKDKFEVKAVDFDQIKQETLNPQSKLYYPKLMKSFLGNDTVMNYNEFRHLYYGYVFQEDYNPFRKSEYSSKIEKLYYNKTFTHKECKTIIENAALSLKDNPFDLRQMEFYIFALKENKKNALASINQFKLNHIIAAILSSGNGTKEKPWVVTSIEHEYNIINFLGYIAIGQQNIDNNIDYITVQKKNDKSPEGFYFDISKIIEINNLKFPNN